jgi:GMP synthase (glutamine-hydrolysing)
MAAGGKCRVSPKGPHVGIAYDIELNNEGKKHRLFSGKSQKFTTPAFNYDEVEIPPKNSILLASDKINKFQALNFNVGKSEVWGLQYHPEISYDYMIKLIKHRSKEILKKKVFKNQEEINKHIDSIEKAKLKLSDDSRTMELKNWLNYLKN